MRALTAGSNSGLCSASTKIAIGTPQARWRETTQSGRLAIMPLMRFSPAAGTQRVRAISSSAIPRRVGAFFRMRGVAPSPACGRRKGASSAMNHCGVLRKISGFFERHECGY